MVTIGTENEQAFTAVIRKLDDGSILVTLRNRNGFERSYRVEKKRLYFVAALDPAIHDAVKFLLGETWRSGAFMFWSRESPETQREWRDKGQRCSDIVRQHLADKPEEARVSWVAIRLSDGGSDGVLYPEKFIAVSFQLHETQCAYMRILPGGISPREATSFLYHTAQLYENRAMRERLIHTDDELLRGR
jgi:hypothetical protein